MEVLGRKYARIYAKNVEVVQICWCDIERRVEKTVRGRSREKGKYKSEKVRRKGGKKVSKKWGEGRR